MKCRGCGAEHDPRVRCEVAARIAGAVPNAVANADMANAKTTTYQYRDEEARRKYQRELMRARRAKEREGMS
jgi:hypothetical protein